MQLPGASAIVTGAGRGIGRAVALVLGRQGAAVALVARPAAEIETAAGEIRAAGGRALALAADLRDADTATRVVRAAAEAHGRLQILVNNAGVGLRAPLAETTDEDWSRIFDTNLASVF